MAFSEAWGEAASPMLGRSSALALLSLREVSGAGVGAALAVAATWSAGFFTTCSGVLPGVLVCLLKSEDCNEVERLAKQAVDGLPKPGGRTLVHAVLNGATTRFAGSGQKLTFGQVKHLDLSGQEGRLNTVVGDKAWVGTFSLMIGDELDTQAILLYAPHGSLQALAPAEAVAASATPPPAAAPQAQPQATASRRTPRREEPAPRNLDRLMGVELEIIVRFGTTQMPLRDVVRLGTGMMIELNRAVDEPVELLVNGKPLARGEVVVIDGYYGVRITEIGVPSERPLSLITPGGLS